MRLAKHAASDGRLTTLSKAKTSGKALCAPKVRLFYCIGLLFSISISYMPSMALPTIFKWSFSMSPGECVPHPSSSK